MTKWIYSIRHKYFITDDIGEIKKIKVHLNLDDKKENISWVSLEGIETNETKYQCDVKPSAVRLLGEAGLWPENDKEINIDIDESNAKELEIREISNNIRIAKEYVNCRTSDPRILAIINIFWNIALKHCRYDDVKDIFHYIPTRDEAIRYLRRNRYAEGYRTWEELQKIKEDNPSYEFAMYEPSEITY